MVQKAVFWRLTATNNPLTQIKPMLFPAMARMQTAKLSISITKMVNKSVWHSQHLNSELLVTYYHSFLDSVALLKFLCFWTVWNKCKILTFLHDLKSIEKCSVIHQTNGKIQLWHWRMESNGKQWQTIESHDEFSAWHFDCHNSIFIQAWFLCWRKWIGMPVLDVNSFASQM